MADEDGTTVTSFAVDADTKEEWENHVEEGGYSSLSHLIRVAVSREVEEESETDSGRKSSQLSSTVVDRLSTIEEEMQELERSIHEFNSRLKSVEQEVSRPSSDVQILASDVFDILPTASEVESAGVVTNDGPSVGTVEWLTDRPELDASRIGVQSALEHLEESTSLVQQNDDGQYYKEVSN
jgi:Arc/MetJ-type ribon-helix-helix transcriptional regulator